MLADLTVKEMMMNAKHMSESCERAMVTEGGLIDEIITIVLVIVTITLTAMTVVVVVVVVVAAAAAAATAAVVIGHCGHTSGMCVCV